MIRTNSRRFWVLVGLAAILLTNFMIRWQARHETDVWLPTMLSVALTITLIQIAIRFNTNRSLIMSKLRERKLRRKRAKNEFEIQKYGARFAKMELVLHEKALKDVLEEREEMNTYKSELDSKISMGEKGLERIKQFRKEILETGEARIQDAFKNRNNYPLN